MLGTVWKLFFAYNLLSIVIAQHDETCEQEIAREMSEDSMIQECRGCKPITIDDTNCPVKGYHCDTTLKMRSNVIGPGGCECSQLRCADTNATLAVEGELVSKVSCSENRWNLPGNKVANSGVCARKCGLGICSTYPNEYFRTHIDLLPFLVNPPDSEHPCAWGYCAGGAVGSISTFEHTYDDPVEFFCGGDRTWRGPDNNRYDLIACRKKRCQPLIAENSSTLCGTDNAHSCYDPKFVDDNGDAEKKMTCNEPNALRYTINDLAVNPKCSLGQWKDGITPIEDDTKVMCIKCPQWYGGFEDDPEQPLKSEGTPYKIFCPTKEYLTLNLFEKGDGGDGAYIKVDSLACTDEFVWDSTFVWEIKGGEYEKYTSLAAAVKDGVQFWVRCMDSLPA